MMRPRRALLFMPGDDRHKIEKGAALAEDNLDCIIMDIEDGVALNRKTEARTTIQAALQEIHFGRAEKLVRINPLDSPLAQEDVAATLSPQLDGYVIPKAESADLIETLAGRLHEVERAQGWPIGGIGLFPIIETARGVVNLAAIAGASPRIRALMFGAEDLAGSIGTQRSPNMAEVAYARSAVVLYAKAYDRQAIDTPYIDIHNLAGLQAEAQNAAALGFDGKLAIHPKHLALITAAFTPPAEQVARAKALIAAHTAHQERGTGVFVFEGRMVDMPMIRAAENILARAPEVDA